MSATAAAAPRAPATPAHIPYQFFTTAGYALLRTILAARLPFDPHDFLLAWTALLLDGNHLLGITATGDGKSCMFYFALLVMQYFAGQQQKPAGWSWPDNPMVLVICPTKGIEEEQAADMARLGIPALAINEDRLKDARQKGIDLWAMARLVCMLFISPEILASAGFAALLSVAGLCDRLVLACIDEAHLLLEWSRDFRKAFLHIGQLLSRLCPKARICALSATVLPGAVEKALCEALGVFWDDIQIMRRSNLRANLQFERHSLKSSLTGRAFPELQWIVAERRTAIIFVDSIRTGWRVAGYMCRLLPHLDAEARRRRIRLYNALNTAAHNEHTRQLLHGCPGTIAIATNALCVGFSPSGVDVVVILDAKTLDEVLQKGGRANRVPGGDSVGKAILYSSAAARREAAMLVAADASGRSTSRTLAPVKKGRGTGPMDIHLARFITEPCVEVVINTAYKNPSQQPCWCKTCNGRPISGVQQPCACNGPNCQSHGTPPSTSNAPSTTKRNPAPPRSISKEMEEALVALLRTLREEWYFSAPVEFVGHLPECAIFPEELMHTVALRIFELDTLDKLRSTVSSCEFVVDRAEELHVHLDIARGELRRKRQPARRPRSWSDSDGSISGISESAGSDPSAGEDDAASVDSESEGNLRLPLAGIGNTSAPSRSKRSTASSNTARPTKRARTADDIENISPATITRTRRHAAELATVAMRNMK